MMNCKTVKMDKFEFYKNKVAEAELALIKAIYGLAQNNFEAMLDEIEWLRKDKEWYDSQLDRHKEALEVCRQQRNEWAKFGFNSKMKSWPEIKKQNQKIQDILEGKNVD